MIENHIKKYWINLQQHRLVRICPLISKYTLVNASTIKLYVVQQCRRLRAFSLTFILKHRPSHRKSCLASCCGNEDVPFLRGCVSVTVLSVAVCALLATPQWVPRKKRKHMMSPTWRKEKTNQRQPERRQSPLGDEGAAVSGGRKKRRTPGTDFSRVLKSAAVQYK